MKENYKTMAKITESKINAINEWIKENPKMKTPNFYEIMECIIETGKVINSAKKYYDEVGYVTIGEKKQTSSDIISFDEKVKSCNNELNVLLQKRDVFHQPFFFENNESFNLLRKVYFTSLKGEFEILKDNDLEDIKEELLKKSISIPFYIFQTKMKEKDYRYDNKDEFENLKLMQLIYNRDTPSGCVQFNDYITNSIMSINEQYKYNNPKDVKTLIKK